MPKQKPKIVRQPNRILHIYCEGEKTEPNYLKGYLQTRFPGDHSKVVVQVEATRKNTPVEITKEAVSAKKSGSCLPDDEFWVVYDREAVAKYSDALHDQARQIIFGCNRRFQGQTLINIERITGKFPLG